MYEQDDALPTTLEVDGEAVSWTYAPARHEAGWLAGSIGEWFEDGTVTDVLFAVRGGKEANVYCCRGGPDVGGGLLACKVYRPRSQRELSNDAMYREGRGLLDAEGHGRPGRDRRIQVAVRKGTRAGKAASHVSWVMHEATSLASLHDAGVTVPAMVAATTNAVLMAFLGDEDGAAPTMDKVSVPPEDRRAVRDHVLADIERILAQGWVHGDLSPYNLVYWQGRPWIIDLPQVSDVYKNPHATELFLRDVDRVCRGLGRGLREPEDDPRAIADAIWDRVFGTDGGVPLSNVTR